MEDDLFSSVLQQPSGWVTQTLYSNTAPHTKLHVARKDLSHDLVFQLHNMFNLLLSEQIRSQGTSYSETLACELIAGHIMEELTL